MSTRLYLPGQGNSAVATPNVSAIAPTSDMDLRIRCAPTSWAAGPSVGTLLSSRGGGTGSSWQWRLQSGGVLLFIWWDSGGTLRFASNSSPISAADGEIKWLRVTLLANNGSGAAVITNYQSDDGISWTSLGSSSQAATSVGTMSAFVSLGSQTEDGAEGFEGYVYSASIRKVIDGPEVASPDFTAMTIGTTGFSSFNDSLGRAWQFRYGAAIVDDPASASTLILRRRRSA